MGRKQAPGLRWHKQKGWYRLYSGKPKYFGGGGKSPDDQDVKREAERRWHRFEAQSVPIEDKSSPQDNDTPLSGFSGLLDHVDVLSLSSEEQRLLNVELKKSASLFVAKLKSKEPTVNDVVNSYLAYLKAQADREPETKRSHYLDAKNRLKHWLKFVGSKTPLSALTKKSFIDYRNLLEIEAGHRKAWLKKQPQHVAFKELLSAPGMSQSSVNKYFTLVKGAFSCAKRESSLSVAGIEDMLSVLRQGKANKRETPLITPEHFAKMLKLEDKWALICLIGMNIAGSNADISRLKWTHIRDDGVFDCSRDKNARLRRIPLWSRTLKALAEYKKTCKSREYVFVTSHGNPYQHATGKSRKDQLGQQFSAKMQELGLPYTFAAVRKSATTVALIGGANETVIKMLLGNASDQVWRHYGMTVPEVVADAVASIEAHYFGTDKGS